MKADCVVRVTRDRTKLSSAVPLWNRTVIRVVVVEMRSPKFRLITIHRDSVICETDWKNTIYNHSPLYHNICTLSENKNTRPSIGPHTLRTLHTLTLTHRQKGLNVLLDEGGDVLPVQNISKTE